MKKVVACLVACACAAPSVALAEESSLKFTVAADYANNNVSFSDSDPALTNQDYKSDMVNLKLGLRPESFTGRASFLTFEAHVGMGLRDDEEPGDIETDMYYGGFIVPHAVVFDLFELSFPVGYSRIELTKGGVDTTHNSVSFGGNVMLPLRLIFPNGPDIRLSAGGQVYHQSSELRVYGYNAGLRWDF
ncbi:hypothetical protein [Algiphilus sp.]|uniref:hypothetical protein n=1 Tax=Algiphilus sp. TaxID=1872431 RepID=UPI0025BD943F|nr:hypothetical protein [Algiphilus sp.]MCK5769431.1 hypothetical protein [Algiphilus sp.]